jgi:GntR family transcriptional regulator
MMTAKIDDNSSGTLFGRQLDPTSFIPFYAQLLDHLKAEIARGVWKPGELLPSEAELCSAFAVSRTVVRRALQEMEYQGIIYRRRGKGTFVAETKVHEQMVQRLTGFYQDMIDQGHTISNQVLRQELEPAGEEVAGALGLGREQVVVICERLRLVDDKPVNFSVSFIPYARCPELLTADLRQQSLYAFVEGATGRRIVRGRRTIETILPSAQIAGLLEIDGDMPVFLITNTCFLDDGTAIEHSRGFHRSDRIRFEVELLRSPQLAASAEDGLAVDGRSLPQAHTLIP